MWRRVHDATELGAAIAALRHGQGMSQAELAEWLGVDRTTIVRLEAGAPRALHRLSSALSALGADLVVLPRTASVQVTEIGGG
jgi:DNA-binding XRE family transcriptional regulator